MSKKGEAWLASIEDIDLQVSNSRAGSVVQEIRLGSDSVTFRINDSEQGEELQDDRIQEPMSSLRQEHQSLNSRDAELRESLLGGINSDLAIPVVDTTPDFREEDIEAYRFCWKTLERIPNRLVHYALLSPHKWIKNHSTLLNSEFELKKALSSDAFIDGVEFAIDKGLYLTFSTLLAYQLSESSKSALEVLGSNKETSVLALSSQFHANSGYFALFAAPIVYGLTRSIYTASTLAPLNEDYINNIFDDLPKEGIWNDYLRWIFPLHPLNKKLNTLTQSILWEESLTTEVRQKAFEKIQKIANDRHGFSRAEGIQQLSKIAYGINIQDLNDQSSSSILDLRMSALETLNTLQNTSPLDKLYQEYELWSLGRTSLWKAIPIWTFIATQLFVKGYTFSVIIEAIIEYLNCPDKPGLTFADGYPDWANDYQLECFNLFVKQFNDIPGQPVDTLISAIDKTNFQSGEYSLDLSNKAINSSIIIEIIKGFVKAKEQEKGPILIGLDLSGNSLNSQEDFDGLFSVIPSTVTSLALRGNYIGTSDNNNPNGTIALGEGIGRSSLISLDLSNNLIGSGDSVNPHGTIALGNGIGRAKQLKSLDLSNNAIGYGDATHPEGTIALGEGIGRLTSLTSLGLAVNAIGSGDYKNAEGTIALGEGIGQLVQLTRLGLTNNAIGYGDATHSEGTIALGEGIGQLVQLTLLDLRDNPIGCVDSVNPNGTIALGQGIGRLTSLTSLDLSYNLIGYGDSINPNGTIALGEGIGRLVKLTSLDLRNSMIGYKDSIAPNGTISLKKGVEAITNSLGTLEGLTNFNLLPSPFLSASAIEQFNIALNQNLHKILPGIRNVTEVEKYFQSIPNDVTNITLSGMLYSCDRLLITSLIYYLQQYQSLTFLDLSYNYIGACNKVDPSIMVKLGEGIGNLTSLTSLDLSYNFIGYLDSVNQNGTIALGEGIGRAKQLQSLDLSNNFIGYWDHENPEGTIALGEGIGRAKQLQSLDLSNNRIGHWDYDNPDGTIALGKGIGQLVRLANLNIVNNWIGYGDAVYPNGTIELGNGIGQLVNLQTLDLSYNLIGNGDYDNPDGTIALGKGIGQLVRLANLKLFHNFIGYGDSLNPNGTIALGEGIGSLTSLTSLDLSNNRIGYNSSIGEIAICSAFNVIQVGFSLKNLKYLNLSDNYIGSTDIVGPNYVSNILQQLLNNSGSFNLAGIKQMSWDSVKQQILDKNNAELAQTCDNQICWGGNIARSSTNHTLLMVNNSHYDNSSTIDMFMLPDPAPSMVTRIVNYLADSIWKGFNSSVEYMQLYAQEVTHNAPSYFPNADNPEVNDWSPYNNSLTTINSGYEGHGVQSLGQGAFVAPIGLP